MSDSRRRTLGASGARASDSGLKKKRMVNGKGGEHVGRCDRMETFVQLYSARARWVTPCRQSDCDCLDVDTFATLRLHEAPVTDKYGFRYNQGR